jgi:hypothetical protein
MRITFALCIASMLSSQALGQATMPLSGDLLRETLIGNTIAGIENGESYSEYLRSDGSISGLSGSDKYSGRWRISGDQICFLYPEESRNWDCTQASLQGNEIIWSDKGGVANLIKGNPHGL